MVRSRKSTDNDENWYVYSKAGLKLFKLRKVLSCVVCVHITNMSSMYRTSRSGPLD